MGIEYTRREVCSLENSDPDTETCVEIAGISLGGKKISMKVSDFIEMLQPHRDKEVIVCRAGTALSIGKLEDWKLYTIRIGGFGNANTSTDTADSSSDGEH